MKIRHLYILILFFCSGCSELINVTGTIINRINNPDNISKEIIISALNTKGQMIPNIKISLLKDKDSLLVFSPAFTNSKMPSVFNLPDDQINPLSSETKNLIVIADHPYIGSFHQTIPLSKIYEEHTLIIEIYLPYEKDTVSEVPYSTYRTFKY